MKRKAQGNEKLHADKESQNKKTIVFKTGTNIYYQTAVNAFKRPVKRRHFYNGCLNNSVSTDDINCKNKGVDLLCIREISREKFRLKPFHFVFKFDTDQVEYTNLGPKNVSF